jgi:hypothetical protein
VNGRRAQRPDEFRKIGNFSDSDDVYTGREEEAMTTQTDIRTLFPLSAEVAWRRYLEATRDLDGEPYDSAEQDAWEELQIALGLLPQQPRDAA